MISLYLYCNDRRESPSLRVALEYLVRALVIVVIQFTSSERLGTCPVTATPVVHLTRYLRVSSILPLPSCSQFPISSATAANSSSSSHLAPRSAKQSCAATALLPRTVELNIYDEVCRIAGELVVLPLCAFCGALAAQNLMRPLSLCCSVCVLNSVCSTTQDSSEH